MLYAAAHFLPSVHMSKRAGWRQPQDNWLEVSPCGADRGRFPLYTPNQLEIWRTAVDMTERSCSSCLQKLYDIVIQRAPRQYFLCKKKKKKLIGDAMRKYAWRKKQAIFASHCSRFRAALLLGVYCTAVSSWSTLITGCNGVALVTCKIHWSSLRFL